MSSDIPGINKVTVTVSVTYSKTMQVYVEDGYTEVDLREAVKRQGLPVEDDNKEGWYCDEFEVIED